MARKSTIVTKEEIKTTGFEVQWPEPLNIEPLCQVQLSEKITAIVFKDHEKIDQEGSGRNYPYYIEIVGDNKRRPEIHIRDWHMTLLEVKCALKECAKELAVKSRRRTTTEEELNLQ